MATIDDISTGQGPNPRDERLRSSKLASNPAVALVPGVRPFGNSSSPEPVLVGRAPNTVFYPLQGQLPDGFTVLRSTGTELIVMGTHIYSGSRRHYGISGSGLISWNKNSRGGWSRPEFRRSRTRA